MKIGYVLKRYPRYSETFIVTEILAHEAAGAEIEIFALRPPSDTHFQASISRVRAPVFYVPRRATGASALWDGLRAARDQGSELNLSALLREDASAVFQALFLAEQVRSHSIDHLHAHFGTLSTTVARLASLLTGISYSLTAHAKDIFHEEVDAGDLVKKLSDAAAVVTVSEYNVEHLSRLAGDADPNIVRIYNGLDLDAFEFQSPLDRPPLVVGVGRLVEKKGFDDLIDACGLMAGDGHRFRCRIIGTGPLEPMLRAQIKKLGLSDRVTLTGPLPQQELRREVSAAAALAAPCVVGGDGNRDGLPTTLLEAMALGTPSVSTDVTGIPEAVRHEDTGLIVPQHDPKMLADALVGLMDRPRQRERLALSARRLIEAEFDVSRSASRLRMLFSKSAAERVAQGRA